MLFAVEGLFVQFCDVCRNGGAVLILQVDSKRIFLDQAIPDHRERFPGHRFFPKGFFLCIRFFTALCIVCSFWCMYVLAWYMCLLGVCRRAQ